MENIEELRKQLLNSNTVADKSRMLKKMVEIGREETFTMNCLYRKDDEDEEGGEDK